MFSKRKVAALVAEFLGTGILTFVVLTVSRSQIGIPYFVAIAAGIAVLMLGLALQRDVQLNPALTIGLWTARRMPTIKAILFIAVQLLGGLAAYSLYKYFSRGTVQAVPTAFDSRILVAEAFGAFVLAFIAAGALYQRLHFVVRASVVGGGYVLGVMIASAAAAGFVNPAVALGANAWAWTTYVLGPVLGAIIGVNLYGLLFAPKDKERALATATASSSHKASAAKVSSESDSESKSEVVKHVEEDKEAVPAHRLDKVDKAEKIAKKNKKKSKK